ncbi:MULTISPECIES: response regulator [Paraburkholderia]|uniref:response regulator n=1 Tax=Paraburkholderia TaxID=1822464 RepID=UPI0022578CD9|nr:MULTISPECIES: response regulator [Paraburkholderia]MCX4159655.1 response regulator [Paraburkholderia aspalathi]MDN7169053.1 response regulator [Paraburkholderia sp. SECH2]MDQ6397540.1 response regulator [Paraburkholderia aspalathi]
MSPPARIIIVDDEVELRNMLKRFLSEHGFDVRTVTDSKQLDRHLQRERFDLVILDLLMEPEDGLSVCRRLRSEGHNLPVLMLTGKGDPIDRAIGLETGADDYLPKPFFPRELLARVKALLRRQRIAAGELPTNFQFVRFGDFRLDVARQLLTRNGQSVDIHSSQMMLLHALALTPNRAVSRHILNARTGGRNQDVFCRSIDIRILRLRQAVEDDPSTPRFIRTVWGSGYMLLSDIEL